MRKLSAFVFFFFYMIFSLFYSGAPLIFYCASTFLLALGWRGEPFAFFIYCFYFLSNFYVVFGNPEFSALSSADSLAYYQQAFLDPITYQSMWEKIGNGGVPIVQVFSEYLKGLSFLVGSKDPEVLVLSNLFFLALGLFFIAKAAFPRYSNSFKLFFLFLMISPIMNKGVLILQKDYLVFVLSSFLIYMLVSFKRSIYFWVVCFLLLAFLSLLRPYAFVFIFSYVVLFGGVSYFFSISSVFFLGSVGVYFFGFEVLFVSILTFISFFASPNFLRPENWISYPGMTFESSIIFVFLNFSFLVLFFVAKWRVLLSWVISLSLCSLVIAIFLMYRLKIDVGYDQGSALLADDVVRKKLQVYPMIVYLIVLALNELFNKKHDILNAESCEDRTKAPS